MTPPVLRSDRGARPRAPSPACRRAPPVQSVRDAVVLGLALSLIAVAAPRVAAAPGGPDPQARDAPTPFHGRSLSLDDIASTEAFGRASLSPDGRWAVYERRGAYDSAPRYDLGPRSLWAITDLWLVDLAGDAAPQRLLPAEPPGLVQGPWSPDGRRLLVQRLRGERLELGIVDVEDRRVAWTGLTPELPLMGQAAEWVSETRLIVMVRPDGVLPWLLRYASPGPATLPAAWAATAAGEAPSRTVLDTAGGRTEVEGARPVQALVEIDLISGERRRLLEGTLTDFAVSPDGRQVAVLMADGPVPQRPERVTQMEIERRHRIRLLPLDGGRTAVPEDPLDVAPHLLRWSPDSAGVLVWARRDAAAWSDGDLIRVARDGAVQRFRRDGLTPLASGTDLDRLRGVRADWWDGRPVLHARPETGARFDWHHLARDAAPVTLTSALAVPPGRIAAAGGDGLRLIADGRLWIMDATGVQPLEPAGPAASALTDLVIPDLETPWRLRVNHAPRRDTVTARTADGATVLADATGALSVVSGPTGVDRRVIAASPQTVLALEREGLRETLVLQRPGDGDRRDLARVNEDRAEVVLAAAEVLSHPDAAGRPTRSVLYRPTDGRAVRGLIVEVYPGPADPGGWSGPLTLTYGLRPQVLAGAGYAVLVPGLPLDLPDAQSPERLARGVDLAVDAALAARPELPGERIAVAGHSWGGYAAAAIATQSTRYQAYVVWAGLTDLAGYWGEAAPSGRIRPDEGLSLRQQSGWVERGQGVVDGPPWRDAAAYARHSPFLAADRIEAPVLLITADQDFVPMSQAERLFAALARTGGRARLVTYWGEEHLLWSPANIRDLYGQVIRWLEETLAKPLTPRASDVPPRSAPMPPGSPPS